MPLDLYYCITSPFCRSVLLTAKALGVELNLKEVDIWAGEQHKPEYLALNPEHTVPTLVDGSLVLWESRAICTYLITKFGKDDALYPRDAVIRAKIDSLLYFDIATLFPRFKTFVASQLGGKRDATYEEKKEKFFEGLNWLERFLSRGNFAAGTDHITVADMVLVPSVTSLAESGFIPDEYTRTHEWVRRCKDGMVGYEEANGEGARLVGERIKRMISSPA
ncbi:glutathione S-transferase 1-1-like isoform X2 [Penaeus japonicus]|nr:glutathione S-transferase 1-1-like isoform X2 [Penaeus japonicus]XP_042870595.1 glutathione S-transferase 1-1-like isoform X2 [Penaeus japonicus]